LSFVVVEPLVIRVDDLGGLEIRALLEEHLRHMLEITPPQSVHALGIEALRRPDITFWTVWSKGELLGCGALKELTPAHGEVKSMRTISSRRRTGVGRTLLAHIVAEARSRNYWHLSLETGSMDAFLPARGLYESAGFAYCGPFGEYTDDPNSVFMTLALAGQPEGGPCRSTSDD
jgi:putative acetyltransferase